jgi:DNA helicase-2/ATP-dependent DNA helicase PcrA
MFSTSLAELALNDAQQRAVVHRGSPLLIVAGAGTGKTKTLVARLAHLIETGSAADRILLLTFTRRSAAEMVHRAGIATDPRAAAQVWGGTFHATANRLLRQFGGALGLPPGFTVLDQGDSADLIGLVRSEQGLAERGSRFPRKETVASIYSRMVNSQQKLGEVLERWFPWCSDHGDSLRGLFTAYTQRKRHHHVLDYDDLLLYWRALAASSETGNAVRNLFDHVLVDEYQDTNAIQVDILRSLSPPASITAVGDDAQAIYGFRAATVENMWRFDEHFPAATRVTLAQNYRSTQPILDVANEVLGQSSVHFPKPLTATRGTGARPILVACRDEAAQSAHVASTILALREQGCDLRDQAVLFRAGHHSDALELELVRRDIPFVKYGGLKYLEAAHVKDLLALLRTLDNPNDELAWHRVLSLLDGVGPATVRRVVDELNRGDSTDPLRRFVTGIGKLPSSAHDDAVELRAALADCLGYTVVDDGRADDTPRSAHGGPALDIERLFPFCTRVMARRYDNAPQRLADLDQLRIAASAYRSRSRFLAELTLDPPERSADLAGKPHLDDDFLILSTIHSAKGCEWKAVHLLHAADGYIPLDMSLSDRDGLEEERRLLYVALTRARDTLSVTWPLRYHVRRYGNDDRHNLAPLSRFVDAVRGLFDEHATVVDAHDERPLHLDERVTLTDEVDTFLESLWT